jgi:hypothetical protein
MGAPAPAEAAARVPRVALIVGPAGSVTDAYRRLADDAADAAAALGAEVVKVYSPDATWPAVKRATAGASIVVYLGHGNGFPSHYRDALYPPTQNGFGLNPTGGGDDSVHQYFGESAISRLQLAPNAVVVLSHLCYASGNSEPGLPEGTRADAVARVDNYAAGFLRAGAGAVVAEAEAGPAYYVRALLRDRGSIESIWDASPTADGRHSIVAASTRTPGYALHLDPRRATGGYTRSLVARGLTAAGLRAGAMGTGGVIANPVAVPSLASAGLRFSEPSFASLPLAGATTRLTLPLATGRPAQIPAGVQVSVRWDPIVLDAPPAPIPVVAPTPSASPPDAPAPSPTSAPPDPTWASPAPSSAPTVDPDAVARFLQPQASPGAPSPTPALVATPSASAIPVAPDIDLVVPEQVGSVVEPARTSRARGGIGLDVRYPTAPGLYRLTATLHTPEGVAYDAATQALLTPVLVHVGGPFAAAFGVPATLSVEAGEAAMLAVKVLNAGSLRWNAIVAAPSGAGGEPVGSAIVLPSLVATWVSSTGGQVPDVIGQSLPGDAWAPGGSADVVLNLVAPAEPGSYLLLLDVVAPEHGPLSSLGGDPAMVRVTVNALAAPAPTPVVAAPGSDAQD